MFITLIRVSLRDPENPEETSYTVRVNAITAIEKHPRKGHCLLTILGENNRVLVKEDHDSMVEILIHASQKPFGLYTGMSD